MKEPIPVIREIILEPPYLHPVDFVEADAEPILDTTGNEIRDTDGNVIYA